jgi:hypothetical protein
MKRLANLGWTFAVGPLFAFTLLGYSLQLKSQGAGVGVLFVAGLVALGSLSAQRRNRTNGSINRWGFDEMLITIGYGLLASTAPLVVGLIGSFHELTGDPYPIGWQGLAILFSSLGAVMVLLVGRRGVKVTARSESTFGAVALVPVALGMIVVLAVILQGGLNGNHIRLFTFQGASWPAIAAGVAIAVPFFFGADASVTQSRELGEDAQRWSRSNLIWLIVFFALLQYSGAIGTALTWPDIPAFTPLAATYVGGSTRGFAWFLVLASGAVYCVLLSVLFSRRLAAHGLSLRGSVVAIAGLSATTVVSAALATPESMFLNTSSVGGAILVAGLAAGCVRAIVVTRSLQMGAMEYAPAVVGLLGLCLAFYGYFWRGVTSAPMARTGFGAIVASVLAGVAMFAWRQSQRASEAAQ